MKQWLTKIKNAAIRVNDLLNREVFRIELFVYIGDTSDRRP